MIKFIKYKILPLLVFLVSVTPALAATKDTVNKTRIAEDAVWSIAFLLLIVLSYSSYKFMKGGMQGVSRGYMVLCVAGVTGFLWKFIGLIKRAGGYKKPEWFFDVVREGFESATGLILGIGFIILFFVIKKKK